MTMRASILVLGGLLAAPVLAQTKAPEPVQAKADKKICRTIKVSGSRLGRERECHNKSEWDMMDAQNNDALRADAASRPR